MSLAGCANIQSSVGRDQNTESTLPQHLCIITLFTMFQTQIFSNFLMITWMSEVKDTVSSQLHLFGNKDNRVRNWEESELYI